jgi:beta-glucosidase
MDNLPHRIKARRWRRAALAGAACTMVLMAAFNSAAQAAQGAAGSPVATSAQARPPACPDGSGRTPLYRDTSYSFAERAADLVSCMTLAEKVLQLHTNSAPAMPRLGVQQYTYWSEGQHGINTMFADTNNGGVSGGVHATSFPSTSRPRWPGIRS